MITDDLMRQALPDGPLVFIVFVLCISRKCVSRFMYRALQFEYFILNKVLTAFPLRKVEKIINDTHNRF